MATTIIEVGKCLTEAGLRFEQINDREIAMSFATKHYRTSDGEAGLVVGVWLDEEGRLVNVAARGAFFATGEHRSSAIELCLGMQWEWKLVRFAFDPSDGEIRPWIQVPLMDMRASTAMLDRVVRCLVEVVDTSSPRIVHALSTGEILPSTPFPTPEIAELVRSMAAFSPAQLETLRSFTPEQLDELRTAIARSLTVGEVA